ncbi:unnamed protein product [Allacma fusca]|uniref:Uncharacterized protein n=1 Tax=Allacma fusca TaxID=39272 RepID=A0A8J2NUX9_9HEXA|nr:unnamed protein product [Allacma fusca]
MNDHGYVRPATVTTPKITPTLRESAGDQGGCENWYSVAETGIAEPYWTQWTKENEGCLREYVLNIRTSRSFHLQDTGLPFLDFVPDYSDSNFPKSLFTKLKADSSHLNAEAGGNSIETPTNDLSSPVVSLASEDCRTIDVDSSLSLGVADSECIISNVGMDIDSEIMTCCDVPLNDGVCLTDDIRDQIVFQDNDPIQECIFNSNPVTPDASMSASTGENEIPLVSSCQDEMPLSFAAEEEILTDQQFVCEEIPPVSEVLNIFDQEQTHSIDSLSSQDKQTIQASKEKDPALNITLEENRSIICTSPGNIHDCKDSENVNELEKHSGLIQFEHSRRPLKRGSSGMLNSSTERISSRNDNSPTPSLVSRNEQSLQGQWSLSCHQKNQ